MSYDPDWWVWYRGYLASPEWAEFREIALKYHSPRCHDCRRWWNELLDGEWLEIDHLNYDRVGHELLEDVQVLCNTCHQRKTSRSRRWRKVKRFLGV